MDCIGRDITPADLEGQMEKGLCFNTLRSLSIEMPGEPISKSNRYGIRQAGNGKRAFFLPKRYEDYETQLRNKALIIAKREWGAPSKAWICLTIVYVYGSLRHKDLPNLPKTTTDALNHAAYEDDYQIHEMHLVRMYDKANPRVIITVDEIELPEEAWPTKKQKPTERQVDTSPSTTKLLRNTRRGTKRRRGPNVKPSRVS